MPGRRDPISRQASRCRVRCDPSQGTTAKPHCPQALSAVAVRQRHEEPGIDEAAGAAVDPSDPDAVAARVVRAVAGPRQIALELRMPDGTGDTGPLWRL